MIKRAFTWLKEVIAALYIAPLKEAFIDLSQFSLSLKILAWGGYTFVGVLLLMTIFFEIFGTRLPMVHFMAHEGSEQPQYWCSLRRFHRLVNRRGTGGTVDPSDACADDRLTVAY